MFGYVVTTKLSTHRWRLVVVVVIAVVFMLCLMMLLLLLFNCALSSNGMSDVWLRCDDETQYSQVGVLLLLLLLFLCCFCV